MPYSDYALLGSGGVNSGARNNRERKKKFYLSLYSYCGDRDDYMETSQFAGSDWTKTFVLLYKPRKLIIIENGF